MQRFKLFFEEFKKTVLQESLQSRIDELVESNVFGSLGEEFIQKRFDDYKSRGVVPSQRLNVRKSARDAPEMVKLSEKDFEEILPFVFKMDREVRDKVIELAKGDDTKTNKINKFYNGLTVRPVFEDASQIKGTLTNWLVFRNRDNDVPKSLRSKIDYTKLETLVDTALAEQSGDVDNSKKSKGDPDYNMPEGFSFIREMNGLRLYKWNSIGTVCELDPTVKKDWLSMKFDVAGDASDRWCVAGKNGEARDQYGEPNDNGDFKYPYYLIRKNNDKGYRPYVLMHGNSKQCKDTGDNPIEKSIEEEIYPAVQGMLETIIKG